MNENGNMAPLGHRNGTAAVAKPEAEPSIFNAKEIVSILQDLMVRVTETAVTPETVQAACSCASQITNLLRCHLEAERLKRASRTL